MRQLFLHRSSLIKTRAQQGNTIQNFFSGSENGFYYTMFDSTTLEDDVGDEPVNNDPVHIAFDQSGNANTANYVQRFATDPEYVTDGQFPNGAVRTSDEEFNIPDLGITGSQNRSFFAVISRESSNDTRNRFFSINSNNPAANEAWILLTNNGNLWVDIATTGYQSTLAMPLNEPIIIGAILDGNTFGDHTVYVNGDSQSAAGSAGAGTTVNTTNVNGTKLARYASATFIGEWAEAFIIDRALTSGEVSDLLGFWSGRYGITV